jgi:hypothetical protein
MRRTWRRCRHPLPARNTFVTIALLVALLVFLPQTSSAQSAQDASGLYQSRAQLVELEKEYAGIAASPAYSSALRDEANQTLERIRQRLQNGDFQSGDRIIVQIRGENVPDEVVVEAGQLITLPVIGQISLAGVLRAELEEHLIKELGRFIQSRWPRPRPRSACWSRAPSAGRASTCSRRRSCSAMSSWRQGGPPPAQTWTTYISSVAIGSFSPPRPPGPPSWRVCRWTSSTCRRAMKCRSLSERHLRSPPS